MTSRVAHTPIRIAICKKINMANVLGPLKFMYLLFLFKSYTWFIFHDTNLTFFSANLLQMQIQSLYVGDTSLTGIAFLK